MEFDTKMQEYGGAKGVVVLTEKWHCLPSSLYNIFLEIFFIKMFLILISRTYLEIFDVG